MFKGQVPIHQKYRITSPFGMRLAPFKKMWHSGIDLAGEKPGMKNVAIYPIYKGIVVDAGFKENSYGNYIIIHHNTAGNIYSLYGHLKERHVEKLEFVDPSQPIGIMGTTGMSTAEHLHLEIRIPYNLYINCKDPKGYLEWTNA